MRRPARSAAPEARHHHHAVGRDHRPYLERSWTAGVAVLPAVKDTLDPTGIMNPGVLAPAAHPAPGAEPSLKVTLLVVPGGAIRCIHRGGEAGPPSVRAAGAEVTARGQGRERR